LEGEGYTVAPTERKGLDLTVSGRSYEEPEDRGVTATVTLKRRRDNTVGVRLKTASHHHWAVFWWSAKAHAEKWGAPLGDLLAERLQPWTNAPASTAATAVGPGRDRPDPTLTHYLLIGLSQQRDPGLRGLPRAVPDVDRLAHALASVGVPEERIRVLKDREAGRAEILAELQRAGHDASPDEAIFVYFAGHVVESQDRVFLAGYDARLDNVVGTMISPTGLDAALGAGVPQLVVIDAVSRTLLDDAVWDAFGGDDRALIVSIEPSKADDGGAGRVVAAIQSAWIGQTVRTARELWVAIRDAVPRAPRSVGDVEHVKVNGR
ncbi:MAG: caspase family protein, partial [Planctomycetes bacterium]|nr:caspase family protein [Planctomycetota bacterium]